MTTLVQCPAVGVWRAYIDGETAEPGLEDHLATCAGCQRVVEELRRDAINARDLLGPLAPARMPDAAEVAVARERFEWRRAQRQVGPARGSAIRRLSTPWRVAGGSIAAAL